jgi:hypothetical protein
MISLLTHGKILLHLVFRVIRGRNSSHFGIKVEYWKTLFSLQLKENKDRKTLTSPTDASSDF